MQIKRRQTIHLDCVRACVHLLRENLYPSNLIIRRKEKKKLTELSFHDYIIKMKLFYHVIVLLGIYNKKSLASSSLLL